MYLLISDRAIFIVGNTIRCTSSFFNVAKNDSATALMLL